MRNNKKLNSLYQLFAKYKIYPKSCYDQKSPVRVFQKLYPDNYYGNDLEDCLKHQNYKHSKRGADLPLWGEKYFSNEKGYRIFIISQDSLAPDAGSIVFFSQLFSVVNIDDRSEYMKFEKNLIKGGNSFYGSWNIVKKLFIQWKLNLDFLYITDASKVYNDNSWKNFDFNKEKSLDLLSSEINLCNPDLIILLGRSPLFVLDKEMAKNYSDIIMNGKILQIMGKKCIVAPFPTGSGRTQKDFKIKIEKVRQLLEKIK